MINKKVYFSNCEFSAQQNSGRTLSPGILRNTQSPMSSAAAANASRGALKNDSSIAISSSLVQKANCTKASKDQHPLRNAWTFWFIQRSSNAKHIQPENYETYLRKIATVSTVEEFGNIYCHLKKINDMPPMSDLHLFKANIRPVWEDAANASGGKLTVRLRKGLAGRLWESLLVSLIGGQYSILNDVCGVVLSNRYQEDIISLWIANPDDCEILKEFTKKVLGVPSSTVFDYKPHNVSIKDTSSHAASAKTLNTRDVSGDSESFNHQSNQSNGGASTGKNLEGFRK